MNKKDKQVQILSDALDKYALSATGDETFNREVYEKDWQELFKITGDKDRLVELVGSGIKEMLPPKLDDVNELAQSLVQIGVVMLHTGFLMGKYGINLPHAKDFKGYAENKDNA